MVEVVLGRGGHKKQQSSARQEFAILKQTQQPHVPSTAAERLALMHSKPTLEARASYETGKKASCKPLRQALSCNSN
jgi:hypothetical protein